MLYHAGRALAAACEGALPLREAALEQGRRIAHFIKTKDTLALRSAPREAKARRAAGEPPPRPRPYPYPNPSPLPLPLPLTPAPNLYPYFYLYSYPSP